MTGADVAQWLLAAGGVAGLIGGLVAAFQSRAARRKLDAESKKLDADADRVLTERAGAVNAMALGLLEPMARRIDALTGEVTRLETQVQALTGEVVRLEAQGHALTDRLRLAQRLLTDHGIALPPVDD